MSNKHVTKLSDFLPYRLSITSNAISDLIASEYRSRFGLKIPEWRVMAILGDVGQATQRELVTATRMDKVAVNRATKAMVQRNLIARTPNEHDGRSHILALSKAGQALYDEIMPLAQQMETKITHILSQEEIGQLSHMLEGLLARVDEIGKD